MDPRLTYGSLLVPSVPAGAAAAAAVAAGLHHPQHLHPFHSQLTSSVHHLTHPLHPFSQPPSTVSHHLNNNHESSPAGSSTNNNNNTNNRSNHNSNNNSNSNINPVTGKVKRARQRVDAGEPRNSYASITNFSSTRSSAFHHPGKSTTGSGLHTSRSSSGVFKSNSSSSLSSSPPSSSSSSSCLSKSQSSGLSYALSSQPSTCSSCSFCSNNQSHHHHHHHHHHNRSSSSHPHLQSSSSTNSGGSGIGIQCNDKMTSQYKENQINFNKQQNVDNIVASLTSPNSNVILGVRGVGGSGSASGISNNSIINLNNMYHNGQSSQQSTKQFVNNYPEESGKHQQSIISFAKTPTSVPSSPLTSPIPLTNKVDHLFNLASTVSSLTPIKSTNSSPVSNLTSTVSDVYESNQQQQVEIGSGNSSTSPSSAYLLRVILQKGRQVGSNTTTNYNQSNNSNQVNCDKIGANCETTRRKGENEEEEKDDNDDQDDQDDEETDSGRTITGSPVNNGGEGGDKVDDEDDNMNNNGNNNEQEDTNDDENEIVTGGSGGVDDDITDEDENVDDDYVKASCSVESEGEPDGGDYSSGRGGSSKPDRYNLDTDEYNNNDIMSLYGESKNNFTSNEKRVTIKSSTDNQVNHDKSDSTTLLSTSTETITCNNNNTDSTPNLPLISDQREQLASSPCSQSSSTTITTLTSTPIGSSSSNKANGPTISDVKRARVENIVTNILPRSNSISGQLTRSDEPVELISTIKDQQSSSSSSSIVNGCKKRKLYHPQQSKSNGSLEDDEDDFLDDEIVNDDDEVEDADDIIIESGVNGGRGREEDDEINDSLIGLSSNTIGDYEMSEIKDLSIKSSVKCEVGSDKSDLIYDEMSEVKDLSLKSLVKREIGGGYKSDLDGETRKVLLSPIIKHEGISTLMAKYETKTDPTSTSISSSNTNTPKDLSKSSVSSSRSNKVSRKDHSHHSSKRHSIGDNLIMKEDDLDGMMADDELVMNDDDLNRESSHHQINLIKSSHHNHLASSHHSGHRRFGGLQDPAQLLNEARKLVYEQEKMTKGSSSSHSSESHHNSNHHNHHHRQSRSSRKRPYPPVATPSSTPTCTIPNGLRPETLPPNATSSPIYYSDIEWLRDTLKAEMQAHLIHLIRQHQHQYYPLHHHQTPQQQAAALAAAAAAATAQLDNHHPQPDQLTPQQREDDLRQRHSHLHPLHHLQDQHHQAAQQQAAAATAQLDHNHSQSEQSPHQRDEDVRQRNHHHHPLLHHPAHQQQAAAVAAQQHHHHHQSEQSPQQRDEDVRQRHLHPHLYPLHHLQDQHHQAAQQQAAALAAAAAQQDQHNQAVQKQQAAALAAAAAAAAQQDQHNQAVQKQQAAALAAAAAAQQDQHNQAVQKQQADAIAAAQQDHHQAATAAAIQNALAVNFAMLAQANRAAGGGDTASPESLSQFGGTRSENGADGSESLNDSTGYDTSTPLMSSCGNLLALQTTLTPMHLRKAKLMFFYVRYPSSNVLKTFFPDIKFNKNNTAQLVKWFSNFREFYYIQMEKYARQAITEGIKNADDIHIHREAELLRVLNMHYNRSNHLDVPERFCFVVEQTLKEFFKSILAGKDNEQSWKKAIYKIISRLDDSVPEYFKSPNFLERLE